MRTTTPRFVLVRGRFDWKIENKVWAQALAQATAGVGGSGFERGREADSTGVRGRSQGPNGHGLMRELGLVVLGTKHPGNPV